MHTATLRHIQTFMHGCARTQTHTMAMQENIHVPLSPDTCTCTKICLRHTQNTALYGSFNKSNALYLAHMKTYVFIFFIKDLPIFIPLPKEIAKVKKNRERIQGEIAATLKYTDSSNCFCCLILLYT